MKTDEPFPLRLAGAGLAATIRAVFARASFEERTICDRLGLENLVAVDQPLFKSLEGRLAGDGLLETLSGLFLFGKLVPLDTVRRHLSDVELNAFFATDLLRAWDAAGSSGDQLHSPIRLVPLRAGDLPARDIVVAGDRADHPDGSPFSAFNDIVFPGHNPLTRRFLTLLPATRPGTVLELCAGSAVAALAMATAGSRCTAADIAERSAHFARFNAWLNGCPEVDVVCGDLYAPVSGRYDCIIAHPPYVPSFSQRLTYRDGGESGEEIVRRVIAGLPDHLNVGGTFHMLCLGMDTAGGRFEDRIRGWLGPASREFDVIFALDSTTPPEQIATRLTDPFGGSAGDILRWRDLFERLQVKEFVYGATVLRRFDTRSGGEACTRRVLMTDETSAAGFEWLLQWFDWLRAPGGEERILEAKPALEPTLRLEVRHRADVSGFTPEVYFLENGGRPFRARLKIEPWVAALIGELDGAQTVREAFASAKARGRVPEGFGEADQGRLMCYLTERSFLTFGDRGWP